MVKKKKIKNLKNLPTNKRSANAGRSPYKRNDENCYGVSRSKY